MDYVFSHFTGIYLAATFWFIVYCIQQLNPRCTRTRSSPRWSRADVGDRAQTAWFVANDALSLAVAFPIITSGPGIVSSLWRLRLQGDADAQPGFLSLAIVLSAPAAS